MNTKGLDVEVMLALDKITMEEGNKFAVLLRENLPENLGAVVVLIGQNGMLTILSPRARDMVHDNGGVAILRLAAEAEELARAGIADPMFERATTWVNGPDGVRDEKVLEGPKRERDPKTEN